jgi:uncharacterized tellurite resistance protein B-like protein
MTVPGPVFELRNWMHDAAGSRPVVGVTVRPVERHERAPEEDSQTFEAIVLLYLAVAKLPDGQLDRAEAARIVALTATHARGLSVKYVEQVIKDVSAEFAAHPDDAGRLGLVVAAAEHVAQTLAPPAKSALVDELHHLAGANGKVTDEERAFVDAIAKTLGVA